jgi:branched-chain amino acid transport system permease protein
MGVGLTLILGILDIPNFAHGALFAIGAYLFFALMSIIPNFWIALIIAPLGVVVIGMTIEYVGVRRLYPVGIYYMLLLLFALSLVIQELIIIIWGPIGKSILPPGILSGAVDLQVVIYPKYRLFVTVMTVLIIASVWLFLNKTKYGAIMRAGIEDKEMANALGINIYRLFTVTFGIGAWLAGLAGALVAPIRGANPAMGIDILVISFVVVALGGLGSLTGAIIAGLVIGIAQSMIMLVWPVASIVTIFVIMAAILLLRPQGLLGTREM